VRLQGNNGAMMKKTALLILLWLLAWPVIAGELTGKTIKIADSDTLTLLTADNSQIKIRLAEIDTPEKGQPYGQKSRQMLADLTFGRSIRVVVQDIDRYGRTVGRVYAGGLDVNAALVEHGAAWVYRKYARDPALFDLERRARADKRGLWALPEAQRQPPWEWRRARRKAKNQEPHS
jgi:endonuclease YncB( thermonuclease family)